MSWKKWNKAVIRLLVALFILYIGLSEILLYRMNEHLGIKTAMQKQIAADGLYGRSILGQDYLYKLEMAKAQKADIISLGSSRVMQFRKEFFRDTVSFYNTGGSMPQIELGLDFMRELTQVYTPKTVIIGVDPWWVNPNFYEHTVKIRRELTDGNLIEQRKFLYGSLFSFLFKNELRQVGFIKVLGNNWSLSLDPVEKRQAIGLLAAVKGDGFRLDGSYQYGQVLVGKAEYDKDFKDTLDRIKTGTRRFEFADHVDVQRLAQLKELIHLLKNKGIEVIVFLPPFAHEVYTVIKESPMHQEFFNSFERSIEIMSIEEEIPFFNYSDLVSIGSMDNEAIDGFHGSDVSYARILLSMSKKTQKIADIVDQERVNLYLENNPNPKGFLFLR